MKLYSDQSGNAALNAQNNLIGRTHYVDPNTLRFLPSRILRADAICGGLLFYIIESCALDMHNTRRGFRPVVFDLFGNVVNNRAKLEDCLSSRRSAERVLWQEVNAMDPVALNLAGLERERKYQVEEWSRMERDITAGVQKAA
jgi:hypothetical protein